MTWARIDDGFHSHPKREVVSLAADGLLMRGLSYAAHSLTDGWLPLSWVERQAGPRRRRLMQELLAAPLLEDFPSGFMRDIVGPRRPGLRTREVTVTVGPHATDGLLIHDFLCCNPARVEVEEKRAADRGKKRGQRARPKLFDGKDLSPGTSPALSPDSRGVRVGVGEEPSPNEPDSIHARPRALSEQVRALLEILAECPRFTVSELVTGTQVENALCAAPDADPFAAAHQAVVWASDPAYRNTNAGAVFLSALRKAPKRTAEDESARRASALRDLMSEEAS